MNSSAQAQQQFPRPPGFYRQFRAAPVPLNREPPVGQPQLPTVPGFVSPALGVPVYGPGQSLPVSGLNPPWMIPMYPIQQPPQAMVMRPTQPQIPVTHDGSRVQSFSIPGAPSPQAVVTGVTQPQPVAGSFPSAPGVPVTHDGGVQSFSIFGPPPPQAMVMGPTQPQPVAESVPVGQGVPVAHPANGTGGDPSQPPPRQPPGFLDNCLIAIRCCSTMEECYRLNGDCCTGGFGDEGCCADVSGLFSFLDSPPQ